MNESIKFIEKPEIISQKIPTRPLPFDVNQDRSFSKKTFSTVVKNSKYTRLVWKTHNDYHKHSFWEVCMVLRGEGNHYFLDHEESMFPGKIWLLRPDDVHCITPNSTGGDFPQDYAHRDLYITEDKMRRILNSFEDNLYDKMLSADEPLSVILPMTYVKQMESTINYYCMNDENFDFMHTVIVSHVVACMLEQKNHEDNNRPDWINELISNFNREDFMIQDMDAIISSTGYSQCYVCRQFKKHVGTTLTQYIQQTKCLYSLSLLADPNIRVIDIAYRLHFNSESNYISIFKKIYKLTPGQWKKNIKSI